GPAGSPLSRPPGRPRWAFGAAVSRLDPFPGSGSWHHLRQRLLERSPKDRFVDVRVNRNRDLSGDEDRAANGVRPPASPSGGTCPRRSESGFQHWDEGRTLLVFVRALGSPWTSSGVSCGGPSNQRHAKD